MKIKSELYYVKNLFKFFKNKYSYLNISIEDNNNKTTYCELFIKINDKLEYVVRCTPDIYRKILIYDDLRQLSFEAYDFNNLYRALKILVTHKTRMRISTELSKIFPINFFVLLSKYTFDERVSMDKLKNEFSFITRNQVELHLDYKEKIVDIFSKNVYNDNIHLKLNILSFETYNTFFNYDMVSQIVNIINILKLMKVTGI